MARIEIFASTQGECSLHFNWWLFALRGVLALVLAGIALCLPGVAVLAMTLVFGVYAVVDGVLDLASGLSLARRGRRWAALVLAGSLGVAAGLAALIVPRLVALGLTVFLWTLVAVWAMATGVLEIATALRLHRESRDGSLMGWSGALSVLLGVSMAVVFWRDPQVTMTVLGLFIAIKALLAGALLLMLAWTLWQLERSTCFKQR